MIRNLSAITVSTSSWLYILRMSPTATFSKPKENIRLHGAAPLQIETNVNCGNFDFTDAVDCKCNVNEALMKRRQTLVY